MADVRIVKAALPFTGPALVRTGGPVERWLHVDWQFHPETKEPILMVWLESYVIEDDAEAWEHKVFVARTGEGPAKGVIAEHIGSAQLHQDDGPPYVVHVYVERKPTLRTLGG